ncbi:hypothetical protein SAMN05216390_10153 [Lachnospiraceae bacterium KH1T2]|nr:hypothetical protein SAMN05216390_10153 [Lachnospiraceae bacterium KH1T2]
MSDNEKVYNSMRFSSVLNIAVGVVMLVVGIASGVLLLVSGIRLLKNKSKILF